MTQKILKNCNTMADLESYLKKEPEIVTINGGRRFIFNGDNVSEKSIIKQFERVVNTKKPSKQAVKKLMERIEDLSSEANIQLETSKKSSLIVKLKTLFKQGFGNLGYNKKEHKNKILEMVESNDTRNAANDVALLDKIGSASSKKMVRSSPSSSQSTSSLEIRAQRPTQEKPKQESEPNATTIEHKNKILEMVESNDTHNAANDAALLDKIDSVSSKEMVRSSSSSSQRTNSLGIRVQRSIPKKPKEELYPNAITITHLPIDVLWKIFLYDLGSVKNFRQAAEEGEDAGLVIKVNQAIVDLMNYNNEPAFKLLKDLGKFLEIHGAKINRLDLSKYGSLVDDAFMTNLKEKCPNLKYLSIKSWRLSEAGLDQIAKFDGLQTLNLNGCYMSNRASSWLLKRLTNLHTLDLSRCYGFSGAFLNHLGGLINLKTLNLTMCDYLTDDNLKHLKGLVGLETLNLTGCKLLTNDGLEHLEGFVSLQTLNLTGCELLTDDGLKHLEGLVGLKALNLYGCRLLTDTGLEHLKGLVGLETLNLACCKLITDDGLEHLEGFVGLKSLNLCGYGLLTDAGLEHLKGLVGLKSLDLGCCENITDASLKHLEGLINLETLDLSRCVNITDAGLEHLKRLINLETLNLHDCKLLTDIGLEHLKRFVNLRTLDLRWCVNITGSSLKRLEEVINSKDSADKLKILR